MRIFRLLRKAFVVTVVSFKKLLKELIILLTKENNNQYKKQILFSWWSIYTKNAFDTTQNHLQCKWIIYQKKNKKKKRIWTFEKTGDSRNIYRNELDKTFQHDMAYGKY